MEEEFRVKTGTLDAVRGGFSVTVYLDARAMARIPETATKRTARKKAPAKEPAPVTRPSDDVLHEELYDALRAWRAREASKAGVPAYAILQQRTLVGIANALLRSRDEMLDVPGVGKIVVERHGRKIFEIIDTCYSHE